MAERDELRAKLDDLRRERAAIEASYDDLESRFAELIDEARAGDAIGLDPRVSALIRHLFALLEAEREQFNTAADLLNRAYGRR